MDDYRLTVNSGCIYANTVEPCVLEACHVSWIDCSYNRILYGVAKHRSFTSVGSYHAMLKSTNEVTVAPWS